MRDELAPVGETVDSAELIRVALNGFSKSWEMFIRGIVARENMHSWERLWDDFVQEELRVGSVSSSRQLPLLQRARRRKSTGKVPRRGTRRRKVESSNSVT